MASQELTIVMEELVRQGRLNRREHLLNRRAYEEGMALCARLVETNARAMNAMIKEIEESTAELRAQRQAILKVIDRMDRLDGGSQAA